MKSHEKAIKSNSTLYFYTASPLAKKTFYYLTCTGHSFYEAFYHLKRDYYDSFLIMYIINGNCTIKIDDHISHVNSGQIVMIDCYKPHEYYTSAGWEAMWIHFDGATAREYYNLITSSSGNIVTLIDTFRFQKYLKRIYDIFEKNSIIREALISNYITNLLTELVLVSSNTSAYNNRTDMIEEIITYINDHLNDKLSLKELASIASLSPYYFTRLFKKEVGMPPHEYVVETRVNAAKFYLKTSSLSIKEIALNLGFTSESSFCTTFKQRVLTTPSEFRKSTHG